MESFKDQGFRRQAHVIGRVGQAGVSRGLVRCFVVAVPAFFRRMWQDAQLHLHYSSYSELTSVPYLLRGKETRKQRQLHLIESPESSQERIGMVHSGSEVKIWSVSCLSNHDRGDGECSTSWRQRTGPTDWPPRLLSKASLTSSLDWAMIRLGGLTF